MTCFNGLVTDHGIAEVQGLAVVHDLTEVMADRVGGHSIDWLASIQFAEIENVTHDFTGTWENLGKPAVGDEEIKVLGSKSVDRGGAKDGYVEAFASEGDVGQETNS